MANQLPLLGAGTTGGGVSGPGGASDALTLETSINDGLLLETGDYLLLE